MYHFNLNAPYICYISCDLFFNNWLCFLYRIYIQILVFVPLNVQMLFPFIQIEFNKVHVRFMFKLCNSTKWYSVASIKIMFCQKLHYYLHQIAVNVKFWFRTLQLLCCLVCLCKLLIIVGLYLNIWNKTSIFCFSLTLIYIIPLC